MEIYTKKDLYELYEEHPELTISLPEEEQDREFNGYADVWRLKAYVNPAVSLEEYYDVEITHEMLCIYCNGEE